MSLPAAKDLRREAERVVERHKLRGTPRKRFLRNLDARLVARLVPTLVLLAIATGAAAIADLFRTPAVPAFVTFAQGVTATILAALALGASLGRRHHVALYSIALAGTSVTIAGWAVVTIGTGGVHSSYALSIPMAVTVVLIAVPMLPWHAIALASIGAAAFSVAVSQAPPSAFILFLLLGGAGWAMARTRQRRALVAFRRVERLGASVARLRRVQDQLVVVEKLEALRVLVGGMAHEINNALAVSIASTEQIVRVAERDPAEAAKAAQRAQRGLVRIQKTIHRLKRFAMSEQGTLEATDLCAILDFALESAVGRTQSGVVIERDYAPDLPPIDAHVAALAEALFQIARNAVESMPKGGTIHATLRMEGADRVVLAVADEGQGIPPARLAKVFDPFYARDTNDQTFPGGRLLPDGPGKSGLGLSAVYGLVSSMGGKVDIRSEVDKGTEVSISLPASKQPRYPSSRPMPAASPIRE